MTGKKFLIFFFLNWVLLALLKVWFFNYQIFSNTGIQEIAFWVITAIISVALVRRFGLLSFLEALFIMFVWTCGILLLDFFLTGRYISVDIFSGRDYWFGLLAMNAAIFLFHKKRHLAVRKELHDLQHAKEHAHDHGHEQKH